MITWRHISAQNLLGLRVILPALLALHWWQRLQPAMGHSIFSYEQQFAEKKFYRRKLSVPTCAFKVATTSSNCTILACSWSTSGILGRRRTSNTSMIGKLVYMNYRWYERPKTISELCQCSLRKGQLQRGTRCKIYISGVIFSCLMRCPYQCIMASRGLAKAAMSDSCSPRVLRCSTVLYRATQFPCSIMTMHRLCLQADFFI